jgi:hypothetical protein
VEETGGGRGQDDLHDREDRSEIATSDIRGVLDERENALEDREEEGSVLRLEIRV